MTRFQAMKAAEADANRNQRPATVVYDMTTGSYEAFAGDLSIAEIRKRNPSYERVRVVWPQPQAA